MPTPVQTERLRFRQMVDDDVEAMAALLGDPTVMRYYPAPMTHDEAAGWIAWNQDNYRRYGFGLWTITDLDGNFIGDCGLTWQRVNGVQRLEIGTCKAGVSRPKRQLPRGTSLAPSYEHLN